MIIFMIEDSFFQTSMYFKLTMTFEELAKLTTFPNIYVNAGYYKMTGLPPNSSVQMPIHFPMVSVQ